MIRLKREIDPKRLNDLKIKIQDNGYLNKALQNIALIITNNFENDIDMEGIDEEKESGRAPG